VVQLGDNDQQGGVLTILTPHEHLDGSGDDSAEVLARLGMRRAMPYFQDEHPRITFVTLADVLTLGLVDVETFRTGYQELARRFAGFGVGAMLPLDRVWVGVSSSLPDFGGFHHRGQGYRHMQAVALLTRYGDLTGATRVSPRLTALDLLRGYGHDTVHWASYRVYTLWHQHEQEPVRRIRFGINTRAVDGSTYSSRDSRASRTTRNLGVVMEGAGDREACRAARTAARQHDIAVVETDHIDRVAYLDHTGQLTEDDLRHAAAVVEPGAPAADYLSALSSFARGVTRRYDSFLAEFGGATPDELHDVIVASILNGSIEHVDAWLRQVHGPAVTFEAIFRTTAARQRTQ